QPEALYYELPSHNVRIEFQPSDFTQVNPEINRKMLDRAIDFLQLNENDQVLDLFCGLGNFSLPMARRCGQLTAVEGSQAMVKKARDNAAKNNIDNIEFHMADLYSEEIATAPWLKKKYNKILLDPPRSGADAVLKYLGKMGAERIVYVSCHPATLARDAGVLVNELGYRLSDAGIMDMFPHTRHVESIAVFVK
ncbi:MAG: 23S rRNA (uracil(1939)-C(5))-methyltransferase RlmD, partial [Gammaproteobacteria bacterium]|nr:23S rRNA (uracil(1939)-C(5))-methyltransferase RlmD [Gammaproteobacteria bacterium]